MKWQLRTGQTLRMLAGDEDAVIYNDHSGDTHLLSAIAVGLLQQLRSGPQELVILSTTLARDWEFESDAEAERIARQLLSELDALGLTEPCLP